MSTWLLVAIAGYFFGAAAKIVDRILLVKTIPSPLAYVFYVGILSGAVVALMPFGFSLISYDVFVLAAASGAFFIVSLWFLYRVLKEYDASRVIPLVIGVGPFITLALSAVFFGEKIGGVTFGAFMFLVIGGVLFSFDPRSRRKFHFDLLAGALGASCAMSASIIFTKAVFLETTFINGIIWVRLSMFASALFLLMAPALRQYLKDAPHVYPQKTGLFLGNKVIGAVGLLLVDYGIAQGSPSFVHALGSFEYFFVFLVGLALTLFVPRLLQEDISPSALVMKSGGAVALVLALILLE